MTTCARLEAWRRISRGRVRTGSVFMVSSLRRPLVPCSSRPAERRSFIMSCDAPDRPEAHPEPERKESVVIGGIPASPSVETGGGARDLRTILAVQALRALLYGFGSILIGAELAHAGYSKAKVGLVLTAMLAGFAVMSVGVGTRGDRVGRRRLYAGLLFLMAGAGTVFAVTTWLPALIIAGLTGTISVEANESGPITI